jgi:hypothetical protein
VGVEILLPVHSAPASYNTRDMQSATMQIVSFCGALMILVAYIGHQARRMDSRGLWYNLLNAAGSGILCYIALRPFQLGFVILEGAWVIVSLWAIFAVGRQSGDA